MSVTGDKFVVLHVLPDLKIGGGQQVVLRSIAGMRATAAADPSSACSRFEHIVCAVKPADGGNMDAQFKAAGIEVIHLGVTGAKTVPGALRRLARLVRDRRVAIIHTNNTGPDRFFGQLAALRRGVPVVNTLHAEPPPSCAGDREFVRAQPWKERLKIAGRDRLTRTTTRMFVAVSKRVHAAWTPYLRQLGVPESGVEVVVSGLDLSGPEPSDGEIQALRESFGASGGPVLMYVARLVDGKGHEHLAPLLSKAGARWPGVRLVLVGDGELRGSIQERFRAAGLLDRVVFLGHRTDVAALLRACDLFVFPSLSEGFGLAVLEAMAAGKPVVAFDLPAFHEFVIPGQTADLVPLHDGEALAAATVALLSDPGRMAAMGQRGRRVVEEGFSVRASVERLAGVYLRVCQANRTSA